MENGSIKTATLIMGFMSAFVPLSAFCFFTWNIYTDVKLIQKELEFHKKELKTIKEAVDGRNFNQIREYTGPRDDWKIKVRLPNSHDY